VADNEYAMRMKMVVGEHLGTVHREVKITEPNPPWFSSAGEGSGKIGFMKGEGLLTLSPEGRATSVKFEGDVQVGGPWPASDSACSIRRPRMLISASSTN